MGVCVCMHVYQWENEYSIRVLSEREMKFDILEWWCVCLSDGENADVGVVEVI